MLFQEMLHGALQLFYPHTCDGCGSDLLNLKNLLCLRCMSDLPHTRFAFHENNPVERIFNGRIPVQAAHSEFYFTKNELIQHLIHQLKYRQNKEIGVFIGKMIGLTLLKSGRFNDINFLVPLPLFADKEYKRGYNQAEIICLGISAVLNTPTLTGNLSRKRSTETQTHKHRMERWQNVAGSFVLKDPDLFKNMHLLLVDDVLTTGATLEAGGMSLLQAPGSRLSLAVIAHASK